MLSIFEDESLKEEKIKAEKGQLLDSGDLPMLPDDMKFIDDFLFYEVKADGKDEIIRKVEKIDLRIRKRKQKMKAQNLSKALNQILQRQKIRGLKQSLVKMIFLKWKRSLKNL
ncbi:cell surface protein, partial [Clostridioides difficile]